MASSDGDRKQKRPAACRSAWITRKRAKTSCHGFPVDLATTSCAPRHDISEGAQNNMPPLADLDKLPEDILGHIHSLMPLRDAARVACVSHVFLRSWRSFPNLTFNYKTLGVNPREGTPTLREKKIVNRINRVLQNHSGIGIKTLKIELPTCHNFLTADQVDSWLQAAVKSGIIELAVRLPKSPLLQGFSLSCSLLSLAGNSLRSISIMSCDFHPTTRISCFESLKSVCLSCISITQEEIGCLFSSTISLEDLELSYCDEITFLNIPSHLQHLSILRVSRCRNLKMIEVYAPRLTSFLFNGCTIKY